MTKLFKVKEKQRELGENANGKGHEKKQSAGELRLHKDISELNLPKTCTISFRNGKDDLMNFEITVQPDEGYYLSIILILTSRGMSASIYSVKIGNPSLTLTLLSMDCITFSPNQITRIPSIMMRLQC